MSSSLHTLQDEGAGNYLEQTLGDRDPLIPEDVPPAEVTNRYGVPWQADYDVMYDRRNTYVGQQSYDEPANLYEEDHESCFSMSPVRRMFCLLSLFDCLLTFLMWVIYLQLRPGGIQSNLTPEINNIKVQTSLFDIVICSFGRTFVLLLFYSVIIKSTKWYIVALTTSASTIFLLMKVFLLEKETYQKGQPLNFFLIIFSFVICWCEAWHFDFKVIPTELQERKARLGGTHVAPDNTGGSLPPRSRRGYGAPSSAFFTPYARSIYQDNVSQIDEEEDSDNSGESGATNLSRELYQVSPEDFGLIRTANDTVHMVFRMLYISDGWTDCRTESDNITVQCRHFDGVGKVYKLEATLDVPSIRLVNLFWDEVDEQPSWNASVVESRLIRRINKKTDILYNVAAEAGGGLISQRDFVSLRRRKRKGALTLLCNVSVELDAVPVKPPIIRGYNGPGGWILRDIPGEPNKTEFIWLLNTELKGWIPRKLVETSLAGVMVNTTRDLRNHVASTT